MVAEWSVPVRPSEIRHPGHRGKFRESKDARQVQEFRNRCKTSRKNLLNKMQLRGDAGSRSAQVGAPSSETQVQESWVHASTRHLDGRP